MNTSRRIAILDLLPEEMMPLIESAGGKRFRAVQVFGSLSKGAGSFNDIKQIPLETRTQLGGMFDTGGVKLIKKTGSKIFNTQKFLFSLQRNPEIMIETVLISEKGRNTVCVSTQSGCNVGCEFCATARMGFRLNLSPGEICSQVYQVRKISGAEITNIVYMGMGEPFLNYANVLKSLRILTHEKGLALSGKRITVSTVGFKGRIKKFADDITQPENQSIKKVKLALSLHSTDNGIREAIIPTSSVNRLPDLYEELIYFYRKTGTKVTYEYIHFPGVNDKPNDIKRIASLSGMIPSNFNIIPFHPIHYELKKPLDTLNEYSLTDTKKLLSNQGLNDFIEALKEKKVTVNLRTSSGVDIDAACGQLALTHEKS